MSKNTLFSEIITGYEDRVHTEKDSKTGASMVYVTSEPVEGWKRSVHTAFSLGSLMVIYTVVITIIYFALCLFSCWSVSGNFDSVWVLFSDTITVYFGSLIVGILYGITKHGYIDDDCEDDYSDEYEAY